MNSKLDMKPKAVSCSLSDKHYFPTIGRTCIGGSKKLSGSENHHITLMASVFVTFIFATLSPLFHFH